MTERELRKLSRQDLLQLLLSQSKEFARYKSSAEELKAKLAHVEALQNRDGSNTGTPTSQTPRGKKKRIPNTRRPTEKNKRRAERP